VEGREVREKVEVSIPYRWTRGEGWSEGSKCEVNIELAVILKIKNENRNTHSIMLYEWDDETLTMTGSYRIGSQEYEFWADVQKGRAATFWETGGFYCQDIEAHRVLRIRD